MSEDSGSNAGLQQSDMGKGTLRIAVHSSWAGQRGTLPVGMIRGGFADHYCENSIAAHMVAVAAAGELVVVPLDIPYDQSSWLRAIEDLSSWRRRSP